MLRYTTLADYMIVFNASIIDNLYTLYFITLQVLPFVSFQTYIY